MASKPCCPAWSHGSTLGGKSKTGALQGMDKVRQVSEHVNLILKYIPYVQTNFVLGLDSDEGEEPFELTKRFLDLTPGAFPGYSLLTAFGRAAALNLDYQTANRVLPFPFHFLNNNQAMNVRPRNYSWRAFYDHVIDLTRYSFSARSYRSPFSRDGRNDFAVAELREGGFDGRVWPAEVLQGNPRASGNRPAVLALFRAGIGQTSGILHGPGTQGYGDVMGLVTGGRSESRSVQLFEVRAERDACGQRSSGSRCCKVRSGVRRAAKISKVSRVSKAWSLQIRRSHLPGR